MEKKMMAFTVMVVMAVVLNSFHVTGECYGALVQLMPCAKAVMGPGEGQPSEMCCQGMKSVVAAADTTQKRRDLCQCLKDKAAGPSFKVDPEKIKHTCEACGVTIPIPIDRNVDCSTVS